MELSSMIKTGAIIWMLSISLLYVSSAQNKLYSFPERIDTSSKYLFYLHGGIVQEVGPGAVSSYYGKYEYYAILDSLASMGFQVISEVRPKGTVESEYGQKIANQVNQLMKMGVLPDHILIVGASLGAYIAVESAHELKHPDLRFVLIGLCSKYAVEYYIKYAHELFGNFLSIYEKSDQKSSCRKVFSEQPNDTRFTELELNMGIDHAFLYKPYNEWINPIVEWAKLK